MEAKFNLDFGSSKRPQEGSIIVSNPLIADINFYRSVVLLTKYSPDEGAIGLILNKPTMIYANETMPDLDEFDTPLYHGGPVDQHAMFMLHRQGDIIDDGIHVKDDLYWGGDLKDIQKYSAINVLKSDDFKFLLGYSSWMPRQLDSEIQKQVWTVYNDYDTSLIFENNSSQMWRKALKNMGGKYNMYANYPVDPQLN